MESRTKRPEEWGPTIGITIIVALLIMGGMYFLLSGQAQQGTQAPAVGAGRA